MRWSLADMVVFVLTAGLALGVYREFWGPSYFNARILLAANLAVLTTATVGAWYWESRWRRMCLTYAIFGWSYLVVVLHGGFGFTPDVFADSLARYSIMGILMGLICALIAYLFIRGGPGSKTQGTDHSNGARESTTKGTETTSNEKMQRIVDRVFDSTTSVASFGRGSDAALLGLSRHAR